MTDQRGSKHPPLAIVGVSALFPGSQDATGFWRDILAGSDMITDVPPSHWLIDDYYDPDPSAPDRTYAKRGAFLKDIDFDALTWGIPPSTLPATDTAQLLALIVAQQVLDDAFGEQFQTMDRSRMSVILGVTSAQELLASMVSRLQRPVWVKALRESGIAESEVNTICDRISANYAPWQEATFPGLLGNVVAGRIANRLDLGGTNCVTDAACASTFSAVEMGAHELYLGESDLAIVGGVDTMNDIFMYMCFSKTPALSRTGDCRPFSDQADGTMLGEGMGMVALKRLDDAERDGDRVYAVLAGIGASSDGRAKSVYAPRPEGQARALQRAYGNAGYGPDTVELVEAHGTGTKAGDAAEFEGLRSVFEETKRVDRQWCALGSVKSQIGHTKAAAGAAGLFKAVMALHHKVLPPTTKVDRPNPALKLEDSPFHLTTRARPWIRDSSHPRRAGVSSFGFGGSNFHLALTEYIGAGKRALRRRVFEHELVVLEGKSGDEVAAKAKEHAADADQPGYLRWLAWLSQRAHDAAETARLAVVATDEKDLRAKLERAWERIKARPNEAFSSPDGVYYGHGEREGSLAFLFPGQGSQYVDMGASLAMHFDAARLAWDHAADRARDTARRLHDVVFPRTAFSDEEKTAQDRRLASTEWAQPAIGCTSLSMLALLAQLGVTADCVAGHSFGELTALHSAGAMSEQSLLEVARVRGELMAKAAAIPGAMTAVSGSIADIASRLEQWQLDVVIANHNSPSQVVLSGATEAIADAERRLTAEGFSARRLPVATAFHSPIVSDSCKPFREYLEGVDLSDPTIPVYANTTAEPYGKGAAELRSCLSEQIAQPVRFVEIIEAMYASGSRTFVEVGPGSVLTGLVAGILEGRPHTVLSLDRKGRDGTHSLFDALGRLVAAGVPIDFQPLWAEYATPIDPKTVAPPRLKIELNGSNYGKPYPPLGGSAELPQPNPERQPVAAIATTTPPSATASPHPMQSDLSMNNTPLFSPMAAPVIATQTAPSPTTDSAWVHAYQETQRQTAEAHSAYMNAMAQSHQAFLRTSESSTSTLAALLTGAPAYPTNVLATSPAPAAFAATVRPDSRPMLPTAPAAAATAMAPIVAQPTIVPPSIAPVVAKHPVVVAAPALDVTALLLEVVADKTGYPTEMLSTSMELEGDLGIDSIKRVEILSAMQQRAPGLPEVDAAAMARLKTLGQIVDYIAQQTGSPVVAGPVVASPVVASPVVAKAAVASPVAGRTAASAVAPSIDVTALLLEIVADKTGYPTEMLSTSMELEGDLGIDSIKRVEILSAMQQRAPGLPEVDAAAMARLKTLGQIVDYIGSQSAPVPPAPVPLSQAPVAAAATIAPAIPAAKHSPRVDVTSLLLEIVAEKTGYPTDMLTTSMELEGDLGIDSIKRVEILSAMQQRAPGLPEVDAAAMARLKTLGQIVEYISAESGGTTASVASVPVAAAVGIDVTALLLEVVADKTGYATDALSTSMELEGDLGIDSIKRVEILSAMKHRAPGLPEVDAATMARLKTLGQIVDYLAEQATGAPRAVASSSERPVEQRLGRFVLEAVAAAPLGMSQPGLLASTRVAVIDGGSGVAEALVQALSTRGVQAKQTDTVTSDVDGVVFLGGLAPVVTVEAALAVNRAAFAAARALAPRVTAKPGLFVTVQDTGGRFGLSEFSPERAWLAGLAGLARTAAQEWPSASVKAIDLERSDRSAESLASVLANELLTGGPAVEVGLTADGQRFELRDVACDAASGEPAITANDVVLVSGGARGVTAATIIALANRTRGSFALLGRTPLQAEPPSCIGIDDDSALKRVLLAQHAKVGSKPTPAELGAEVRQILGNREIQATLAALAKADSRARYIAVDVNDAEALTAAVDSVRTAWGPIKGVIHGAGVIADRAIEHKTDAQFDAVFDTKVEGLRSLLTATANDPLRLLLLFSSVSARTGNAGQCDYAMANEVLNKVAEVERRRRGDTCVVRSLGWGPWAGGMVTPALEARFKALDVPLIPLAVGAEMLVSEVFDSNSQHVELCLGGKPRPEALLAAREQPGTLELSVVVEREHHPYLQGHAIQGRPVVPVVLVLEWFARAARTFQPDRHLAELRDLKVLRGVRLDHYTNGGDRLMISCSSQIGQDSELKLALRGPDGTLHYSARASMRDALPNRPTPNATDIALDAWNGRPIYGDVLFHERDFQVIKKIDGISKDGMSADLDGICTGSWPNEHWHTDVAALDGGLQLSLLWSQHMLGGASLPTCIDEVRLWSDSPVSGPIRCNLRGRHAERQRALTDVELIDDKGQLLVELVGVETHLLPGTSKSEVKA